MRGVADPMEGQEAVRSTAGPMAHSPDDIDLVMKVYMLSEPWRYDPVVLNLPWNMAPHAAQKKFCFAVTYGDELVGDSQLNRLPTLTSRPLLTRPLCGD